MDKQQWVSSSPEHFGAEQVLLPCIPATSWPAPPSLSSRGCSVCQKAAFMAQMPSPQDTARAGNQRQRPWAGAVLSETPLGWTSTDAGSAAASAALHWVSPPAQHPWTLRVRCKAAPSFQGCSSRRLGTHSGRCNHPQHPQAHHTPCPRRPPHHILLLKVLSCFSHTIVTVASSLPHVLRPST